MSSPWSEGTAKTSAGCLDSGSVVFNDPLLGDKVRNYDSSTFRCMINRFKKTNGIGPNDDLEFEETGGYFR
ncbi:hypothetical protein [Paraburkholderia bannensis]|uniref:hypothetical protein n=1 Tax=Paraburkholderia bannensis TaxID=765414 RepID=UPI002AB60388|nr:hypothetical protein [Paraburkholderia bannensis]